MNRKKILMLAGCILGVVLLLLILPKSCSKEEPSGAQSVESVQSGALSSGEEAASSDTLSDGPSVSESEKPAPAPTPNLPQSTVLPYAIPDTTLVIEAVNSYDGVFLEDGSDSKISGVASIILKNTGDKCVEYVKIHMTGSKTNFEFVASALDAGATMVVQEAKKAPAVAQEYSSITADVALTDHFELSEQALSIEETKNGQLRVTNRSGRDIPCVRLFYKFYMEKEQVFVGGITYTAKLVDLKAGASMEVTPSHYLPGGSRVIMAKLYDTAE